MFTRKINYRIFFFKLFSINDYFKDKIKKTLQP